MWDYELSILLLFSFKKAHWVAICKVWNEPWTVYVEEYY
jgi:hypothetical protein